MANIMGNGQQLVDEIIHLSDKVAVLEGQITEIQTQISLYQKFLDDIDLTESYIRRLNQSDRMELRDWIKANL